MTIHEYSTHLLPFEKVLRDPVHDFIYIEHQLILELLDTREFQRLRRIKQLGAAQYTFHGAEHSRFSHSVGVYELTRRICDLFQRNYPIETEGENGWDDSERLVALCAALLHDIGHGPYSHTFESIFGTDHEEWSVHIILSPDTEVNRVLRKVSDDFPKQVASVIQKTYPNPQVVQMISSQLDADRMDYLQRDAYFTGVTYGTFDLTRILRIIRPHKKGIVCQIQGMHAVEDYIVSRYQMYMQVYFHRVSRGMEVTLDRLLQRASDLHMEDPRSLDKSLLTPFLNHSYTLQDYLNLDDAVLTTCFNSWRTHPDPILSDLAIRFLDRRPLKSVTYKKQTDTKQVAHLISLIEDAGYHTSYYTALNNSFDLPYDFYRPKTTSEEPSNKKSIELIYQDGTIAELSQVSEIVQSLTGKFRGDERLYVPREFLDDPEQSEVTIFDPLVSEFRESIHNGAVIHPH